MLFLIIALVGLSVSSYHPLGSSIVAHTTPGEKLGSVMSYYIAGGNAGYALAPFVVVLFLAVYPTTMLPWLTIPAFIFALLCAKKKLHRIPTQVLTQRAARIDEILKNKNAVVLTLSMAFRCIPHVSTTTFLPLLLVTAGYSSIMSGTMLTLFLVGCTVGGLIGGYLGDRFSHKAVVVSSLFLGIFPTAYFFFHAGTEPLSCIALFLAGAFILAPQPSSLVWAQKAMPGAEAVASGLMMGFSFGLASLGAAAIAALGDHIGLGPALLISVISLPIGGKKVILRMKVRRYKCKCADCDYDCQERISFAPGSHSYTRLLKGMPLKETAHLLGVSWDTIKEIHTHHLECLFLHSWLPRLS